MQLKVLVVEDEQFLREILSEMLAGEDCTVTAVEDAASACQFLALTHCDLVMSDIHMPRMDGLALLNWMREKNCNVPVVLMSGYTQEIDTESSGVMGFLRKPFGREEIVKVLAKLRKSLEAVTSAASGSEAASSPREKGKKDLAGKLNDGFCRLSIQDFVSGKSIPFSIFVKLRDNKYIKIAHSGEDIDLERLKAYHSRKVDYLYLKTEDFQKYLGQSIAIARRLSQSDFPSAKRTTFFKHASDVILENIYVNGVCEESFAAANNFIMAGVSTFSNRNDLMDLISILNSHADFLYAHSMGVALYSVMICQQLGWNTSPTTITAMLCGLFHDIGKKELERELLSTKRIMHSQAQRRLFESHCTRGGEILSAVPDIPAEVIQVAIQHHENCLGRGYPNSLTKGKMLPLSRLIAVADTFCQYVLKSPEYPEGMTAKEGFVMIEQFHEGCLDRTFLDALKAAVAGKSAYAKVQ